MRTDPAAPPAERALLLLGAWFGLLTGFVDVVIHSVGLTAFGRYQFFSRDFVWMAPAIDLVLFVGIATVLLLAQRLLRFVTFFHAVFVLAGCSFASALFLVSGLHRVSLALLAAGLAFQTARLMIRSRARTERIVTRTTPFAAGTLAVIAVVTLAREPVLERQRIAALPSAATASPNLILLVLDTVRADNLSLYGYQRPTTPVLSRLAQTSVVFEHAIAPSSWTLPSHASMFTGRPAEALSAGWLTRLDDTAPTVAEALAARGYLTAGFVANPWYAGRPAGVDRGFVHFEDYARSLGEALNTSSLGELLFGGRVNSPNGFRRALGFDQPFGRQSAAEIRARFVTWLDGRTPARPFFAFMNWYDAHAPYQLPESGTRVLPDPGTSMALMDLYDESIAYLDRQIGELMEDLRRRDLAGNTVVIITSDHGEQFGEHGLALHGNSLYLPLLRVPLMIVPAAPLTEPRAIESPVSLTSMAATLLELAGGGAEGAFDAPSLAEVLRPGAFERFESTPVLSSVRRGIHTQPGVPVSRGDMFSVIARGLHLILHGDGTVELYDVERDPAEDHDLAGSAATQAVEADLRQLVRARARRAP